MLRVVCLPQGFDDRLATLSAHTLRSMEVAIGAHEQPDPDVTPDFRKHVALFFTEGDAVKYAST